MGTRTLPRAPPGSPGCGGGGPACRSGEAGAGGAAAGSAFRPWKAEVPFPGAAACGSLHEQDAGPPRLPPQAWAPHTHRPAGRNESPRASARRGAPGLGRQPCPRPSASSCVFAGSGLVAPLLGHWLPASKQEAASWLRGEALWTGQTGAGEGRALGDAAWPVSWGDGRERARHSASSPARSPPPVARIPPAGRTHPPGTHRRLTSAGLGRQQPPAP